MRELGSCPSLSVLDLSQSLLEEPEVLAILSSMPELHVLNMTNNHIQQTTGGVRTSTTNATALRRVQEKHDLQLPQADLPGLTTGPT